MTLFVNAHVHTFDPSTPQATAVLTDGETVQAVGNEAQLRALSAGAGHNVIDLDGNTVIPGMVDAHLHTMSAAEAMAEIDVANTPSLPEAIEAIRVFATGLDPDQWITGGRWDFTKWGMPDQPTREALDAILPHTPVALASIDYHTLWCNTEALRRAGIHRNTPNPTGGEFARDEHGELTGIVRENAAEAIYKVIPELDADTRLNALKAAQQQWLSEGLTTVHDIDGEASRKTWLALGARADQHVRTVKFLRPEELNWAKTTGWRTGGGDDWFRHGGLKLFSDGALGSQTSHMSKPYPHEPGQQPRYGVAVRSEEELRHQVLDAYANGIVSVIHAIGDQANHHVLNVFEATEKQRQKAQSHFGYPLRPRIEHTQFLQPADVARLAKLGVIASMQPRHCISDLHLIKALSPDEALAAYAWTDIEAAGGHLAFGSDGPVEPSNPFVAIYAALTRADVNGDPTTTFQPARRMNAYNAIAAHTLGPAYSVGQEQRAGAIKPGHLADFIAVNYDPLTPFNANSEEAVFAHATAVRDTVVNTTVVGGEVKFRR